MRDKKEVILKRKLSKKEKYQTVFGSLWLYHLTMDWVNLKNYYLNEMNSISICLEMTKSFESLVCRTKLTNVSSENMFKDLIAGHARELVNSQVQETTFWNILSYETFTFSKNVLCAKM